MVLLDEQAYRRAGQAAADALDRYAAQLSECPVLVGFDGFVDSIIAVVDQRENVEKYRPMRTIEQFGKRISAAAGHSSNFELVVKLEKLGGNGPIMANALASIGYATSYVGALGYPNLHPVFREFAERADCYTIAKPGLTDALEFDDGKLMLGKYEHLGQLTWDRLIEVVGEEQFTQIIQRSGLIGMVNWTMLPGMVDIWQRLVDQVLPGMEQQVNGRRRMVFIDLADPEKRTRQALDEALSLISRFQAHVDVTFGMNLKEATQVAAAMGIDMTDDPESAIEPTARKMVEQLGVHCVVIHPLRTAAGATRVDGRVVSSLMPGPYVRQPKLSTGAGDNFNAGVCLGMLAGLPIDQALVVGNATSGHYVRNAASPTLSQIATFCRDLPMPE